MKTLCILGAALAIGVAPLVDTASAGEQSKGQPPVPDTLEKMLAEAMQSNPDVVLAMAEVRQAQAKLNAARLRVTKEVVDAAAKRRAVERAIKAAKDRFVHARKLHASQMISEADLAESRHDVIETEAALTGLDAELRFLLGVGGARDALLSGPATPKALSQAARRQSARKQRQMYNDEMPEAIRKALEKKVSCSFIEVPLTKVAAAFGAMSGMPFIVGPTDYVDPDFMVTMELKGEHPLGHVLLALADRHADIAFVVRDYGILVTDRDLAQSAPAPTIPAELPYIPN